MLDALFPRQAFGAIAFSSLHQDDFLPTLHQVLGSAREEINRIATNPAEPDFCNTVVALEQSGHALEVLSSTFFNLHSANTNPDLQRMAQEFSPLLTAYQNDVLLNEGLFKRIQAVWDKRHEEQLDAEDLMLLSKTYKAFTRNGANLSEDKKHVLRKLDEELARATVTFGEHVLKDTQEYAMQLEANELDGLPEDVVHQAKEAAKERDLPGYVITLDGPVYLAFMTYSTNREKRKELFEAFGKRGLATAETNNLPVLHRIAYLRKERATLLGYPTYAHFVLEERMASTPQTVTAFLQDLLDVSKAAGAADVHRLAQFAKERDGLSDFNRWDFHHYAERLKQTELGLEEEKLKPYFPLHQVVDGVFQVAHKLYGLSFVENAELDRYHPEVQVYEVRSQNDDHLALLYTDFFPRKGKRAGAWMTSFKPMRKAANGEERPHISIVCNFTKPTASKPSLLTFQEVLTLFHEFGHALHGMLAKGKYASLTGTNVYWDFVELPSQILENWCYEEEALQLFAKHYENGSALPQQWVQQLAKSNQFLAGYATCRQIGFGLLDMAFHGDFDASKDPVAIEQDALAPAELFPFHPTARVAPAFSHIFSGGYAAGYYSYKWAEVLDADAFERFKEEGLFNPTVSSDFYELLAAGGTQPPDELFAKFRGRQPDKTALLKRAGLL